MSTHLDPIRSGRVFHITDASALRSPMPLRLHPNNNNNSNSNNNNSDSSHSNSHTAVDGGGSVMTPPPVWLTAHKSTLQPSPCVRPTPVHPFTPPPTSSWTASQEKGQGTESSPSPRWGLSGLGQGTPNSAEVRARFAKLVNESPLPKVLRQQQQQHNQGHGDTRQTGELQSPSTPQSNSSWGSGEAPTPRSTVVVLRDWALRPALRADGSPWICLMGTRVGESGESSVQESTG